MNRSCVIIHIALVSTPVQVNAWKIAPTPQGTDTAAAKPIHQTTSAPPINAVELYKKEIAAFGESLEKLTTTKKDLDSYKKELAEKIVEARSALVEAGQAFKILEQPTITDAQNVAAKITTQLQKVKAVVDSLQGESAKKFETLSSDAQKLLTDIPVQLKTLQEKGIALAIIEEPIKKTQAALTTQQEKKEPIASTEQASPWWKRWWNTMHGWITSWFQAKPEIEKKSLNHRK